MFYTGDHSSTWMGGLFFAGNRSLERLFYQPIPMSQMHIPSARLLWACLVSLLLTTTCTLSKAPEALPTAPADTLAVRVPLGGNSWITGGENLPETLTAEGLANWSSAGAVVDTYVRFGKTGQLTLSARLRVPTGKSRIRVTVGAQSKEFDIAGSTLAEHRLGEWRIETLSTPGESTPGVATPGGYVKISLQGVRKTGATYAEVTYLGIGGEVVDGQTAFVRNNEGNFYYWGRRGPSVHLRYPVPAEQPVEWFYNEITVPTGNDVIGSYYMANGFGEGYFGMQVNSATERRILFSVWSPFQTDDPKQIPENQKIRLDRKGPDVVTNEFGNEGSGGQSFLRYNWQAGQTYAFLLRGQPGTDGYTTYTAYFRPVGVGSWRLIASFRRPQTNTYLKSLYSFLENFVPNTGNVQREAEFGNAWARTREGQWIELNQVQFTGDNTARKSFRMDYAGGLSASGRFFLRNCGFFDRYTPLRSDFTRPARSVAPAIDWAALP